MNDRWPHDLDKDGICQITEGSVWTVRYELAKDDLFAIYKQCGRRIGDFLFNHDPTKTDAQIDAMINETLAPHQNPNAIVQVYSALHYSNSLGWHRICSSRPSFEIKVIGSSRECFTLRVFPTTRIRFVKETAMDVFGYQHLRVVFEGSWCVWEDNTMSGLEIEEGDSLEVLIEQVGC